MFNQTLLKRVPAVPLAGSYARCYFSTRSRLLVETSEVEELIKAKDPKLRIINASWYFPGGDIDAYIQHEGHRLTDTTQFFSIAQVIEAGAKFPNMIPSAAAFAEHMRSMRVGKHDQIICYDHLGMLSVARCAWMLRYFGASNVRIMNGGFTKWLDEGRPIFAGDYTPGAGLPDGGDFSYEVTKSDALLTDLNKVHDIVKKIHDGTGEWQITDSRPAPKYNGEIPEPEGCRQGHIPGSKNIPFSTLSDPKTGCLKSDQELKANFEAHGLDLTKPAVHMCNIGVTTCAVQLAWEICGGAQDTTYVPGWQQYGRAEEPDYAKKA